MADAHGQSAEVQPPVVILESLMSPSQSSKNGEDPQARSNADSSEAELRSVRVGTLLYHTIETIRRGRGHQDINQEFIN